MCKTPFKLSLKFSKEFSEFIKDKRDILDEDFYRYCKINNIKIVKIKDYKHYLDQIKFSKYYGL
jgi:hypothetical protein